MKRLQAAVLATAFLLAAATAAHAEVKVRFATSAPDGSLQVKVMRAMAKKIEKETGGAIKMQLFAGGTVGDDYGVIRKMKLGNIDAAGLSGAGLGEILPEARIFELPFVFETEEQVDCVRSKLQGYFTRKFDEAGYILLGWADVGMVYLFSKKEISGVADMAGTKPWAWKGDPIGDATFKKLGLTPTALQLQDVLTSLQTGLIDTFYITPALSIALQWNVYATYMVDAPLVNGTGAVVVKKEIWQQIPAEHQAKVKEIFAEYLPKLVKKTRQQNAKSIGLMEKQGLKRISVPKAEVESFRKKGWAVAESLVGKLYPKELLDKVKSYLAGCK